MGGLFCVRWDMVLIFTNSIIVNKSAYRLYLVRAGQVEAIYPMELLLAGQKCREDITGPWVVWLFPMNIWIMYSAGSNQMIGLQLSDIPTSGFKIEKCLPKICWKQYKRILHLESNM